MKCKCEFYTPSELEAMYQEENKTLVDKDWKEEGIKESKIPDVFYFEEDCDCNGDCDCDL